MKHDYEFTYKGHEYYVDGVEVYVTVSGYADDCEVESVEITEANEFVQVHPSGDVVIIKDKALIKELDEVLQELVEDEVTRNLADYLPDPSDDNDSRYDEWKDSQLN